MSDADEPAAPGGLSFERAVFENQREASLSCGYCKKPLSVQYWQIAKRPACGECRAVVQRELEASTSRARFIGALQYGALAAAAGSVGWIVITKVTGYELSIVAIGIGYLVGKAVRKGAGGFGGTRYQYLAMFLTYSAIALASLPAIFEALRHSPPSDASAAHAPVGLGAMLMAWGMLLAFAYASPFLGGMRSIMGLFIIGIGLYEAWKLTRAIPLQVLGPFPIESSAPEAVAAPTDATH
jgi:hypothetical protein